MTETATTEKLLLDKDGPIGWITFNQPEKRNAVSQEMWQRMPEYVADLSADDSIRVVILRGAGEQAFVAGADISQFKDRRRNAADEEEYRRISGAGQRSTQQRGVRGRSGARPRRAPERESRRGVEGTARTRRRRSRARRRRGSGRGGRRGGGARGQGRAGRGRR